VAQPAAHLRRSHGDPPPTHALAGVYSSNATVDHFDLDKAGLLTALHSESDAIEENKGVDQVSATHLRKLCKAMGVHHMAMVNRIALKWQVFSKPKLGPLQVNKLQPQS
jgi:hypothetical protein